MNWSELYRDVLMTIALTGSIAYWLWRYKKEEGKSFFHRKDLLKIKIKR